MSRANRSPRGFTLVELMLAMAFIGVLLIVVTMTVIQLMRVYNRGLTLKEVNAAGRSIADDFRRTIASSRPFVVEPARTAGNPANPDSKYVASKDVATGNVTGGRLCTGQFTYAWNTGWALENGRSFNLYDSAGEPVRLAKVADTGGQYCTDARMNDQLPRGSSTELLSAGDRELAVHRFEVTKGADDPLLEQSLYTITIMIGTPNDAGQIDTMTGNCRTPDQLKGLEDYCAVNVFDIVARAGNRIGGI